MQGTCGVGAGKRGHQTTTPHIDRSSLGGLHGAGSRPENRGLLMDSQTRRRRPCMGLICRRDREARILMQRTTTTTPLMLHGPIGVHQLTVTYNSSTSTTASTAAHRCRSGIVVDDVGRRYWRGRELVSKRVLSQVSITDVLPRLLTFGHLILLVDRNHHSATSNNSNSSRNLLTVGNFLLDTILSL